MKFKEDLSLTFGKILWHPARATRMLEKIANRHKCSVKYDEKAHNDDVFIVLDDNGEDIGYVVFEVLSKKEKDVYLFKEAEIRQKEQKTSKETENKEEVCLIKTK